MARILTKYKNSALFTAVAAAIAVLSLIPKLPQPVVTYRWMDKVEHLAAYAVFGASLFNALPKGKRTGRFFTVLTVALVYGGIIEFLQQYTGRTPELFDLLADFLGAAAGALIYSMLFKAGKV